MMPINHILRKWSWDYKCSILKKRLITLCTRMTSNCLLFAKKGEKNGESDTNKKNLQPGYRNGIQHWNIYGAHNEK